MAMSHVEYVATIVGQFAAAVVPVLLPATAGD